MVDVDVNLKVQAFDLLVKYTASGVVFYFYIICHLLPNHTVRGKGGIPA